MRCMSVILRGARNTRRIMSSQPNNSRVQTRRPARRTSRNNNKRGIPISSKRQRGQPRLITRHNASQSLVLSGTDTFQLHVEETQGFQMVCNILANPLYWYGTRIAGIAKVYQKYRPKFLRYRYVPSCPATTAGSITIGVLEAGVTLSQDTAVTTLLNSGGKNFNIFETGFITYLPRVADSCYIDGDITKPVVNPFCFFMYSSTKESIQPGLIYIDWEYEFYQGSGDQQLPIATITNTTPENILALQSHSTYLASAKLTFGWGAVLGFLKTAGVPILRKIGIVVCKSVLAMLSDDQKSNAIMPDRKLTIREGTYLTIDPSDIYSSPANYTRVKDSNGSDFYLPDDSRVSVYMSGDRVEAVKAAEPVPPADYQVNYNIGPTGTLSEVRLYTPNDKVSAYIPPEFLAKTDYWITYHSEQSNGVYTNSAIYFNRDGSLVGYDVNSVGPTDKYAICRVGTEYTAPAINFQISNNFELSVPGGSDPQFKVDNSTTKAYSVHTMVLFAKAATDKTKWMNWDYYTEHVAPLV